MEGDPQVKGKIKEVQRRMAQSRMMQQVPKADVVIRNPTHLQWRCATTLRRMGRPLSWAKDRTSWPDALVRKAEEHHIAIIENVPLARAGAVCHGGAESGDPELYNAVAEVLVYLYRMDEKLK